MVLVYWSIGWYPSEAGPCVELGRNLGSTQRRDYKRSNRKDLLKGKKKPRRGKRDSVKSIARKVKVPREYRSIAHAVYALNYIHLYFGGMGGDPLGPGHGHYVMDYSGNVIYRRDPNAPRGIQNYTDYGLSTTNRPRVDRIIP